MKSREQTVCTNCKEQLDGKRQVFQGVVICGNCYKLVSHSIKKTQGELKMLFLVYTDMIRVGLLKGEFRPPVMPAPGKTMPPSELAKAMQEMAKHGEKDAKDSESPVPGVSGDKNPADGEIHDWRHIDAVSGRR